MDATGREGGDGPFHGGELALQDRAGVRERTDGVGRKFIRDRMPDQHRAFFGQLPFLVVGGVDAHGQPWASMLAGCPGFVQAPDPCRLRVGALPAAGDPLGDALAIGADIGVLGVELSSRRRNRLNGRVAGLDPDGFDIAVVQSFGNCPRYIQLRALLPAAPGVAGPATRKARPDDADRRLIRAADTFFIASAHGRSLDDPRYGADVSHRGGKPGFVRVDADGTLTIPDFAGNAFFNTLGNLAANPKAGLLFVDFATGDALHLAGAAAIVWDGPDLDAFAGAQRLLRIVPTEVIRRPQAVPLRWRLEAMSPALDRTGTWPAA